MKMCVITINFVPIMSLHIPWMLYTFKYFCPYNGSSYTMDSLHFLLPHVYPYFFPWACFSYLVYLSIFLFQKYRLHLRRVKPNPVGDASERHNSSYNNMNNQGSFMRNHEHERWCMSSGLLSPNNFYAMGHLAQPANTHRNSCTGSVIHDGRM